MQPSLAQHQDDAVLRYNSNHVIETVTRPTKILGKMWPSDMKSF